MMRWVKEVWMTMLQSLRILFSGKQTFILLLGSLVLLASMLFSMDEVKEEKSKIAIGMVDKDDSRLSEEIIAGMLQKDLYEVVTGEEKELVERLAAGELAAVCVLKEGFATDIARGKTDNLVTIYETKDSSALLLGDILAGVMMQEICTAKSYETLLSYEKKTGKETTLSAEEYRTYVNGILSEGGTEFSFDVTYVSVAGTESEKPSQAVIYEQAIFAVFALMTGLLAIYTVLPFRQLKHGRLAERMKTLPVHESALYVGSALAGFIIPIIFGALFMGGISLRNQLEFSKILSLLICTAVYICVIVCMMLLAAYGIKNHVVYQMGMLAMILVFGVFGLVTLVDGLLVPEGTASWVPNGWYVRIMTELLYQ